MPKKNHTKTETSAFKNWINADVVERLALHIQEHQKDFAIEDFKKVIPQLQSLELKPRVQKIRDQLKSSLPESYPQALALLLKAVHRPKKGITELSGFDLWAVTEFIQVHGLEHFNESLEALKSLTKIFTAEFAIRPFLIHHEKKTLSVLNTWAKDPNHHVRRLVSEGSRPRLPWGEQLRSFIKDPTSTVKLLEKLKYDDELYVRKSVANHLNDISKDHPELAIKIATQWILNAPEKHQTKIAWIVKHALRTLLKKGHPKALKLLGYNSKDKVDLKNLKIEKSKIRMGQTLEFSFDLLSKKSTPVMVDYIIHHQKANGETKPKVFKLTTKKLTAGVPLSISKKHSFKKVTTRVYYPGQHYLEIMINGVVVAKKTFELTT